MHVDWNWIKQRPHFIAEKFAEKGIDVDVYFNKYKSKGLVNNDKKIKVRPIPQLRGNRFMFISWMNRIIYILFILFNQNKYDYIYISHPKFYTKIMRKKIIFDCMDDYVAFNTKESDKQIAFQKERNAVLNSELIIFSAEYLRNVVINRQNINPKKTLIINNAIQMPSKKPHEQEKRTGLKDIIITYIGTISDWFDFNLLDQVKECYKDKNLIFNLYGPVDLNIMKPSKNVNLLGSINHDKIFDVMEASDILMMPFVVTDLIKSVNPVKLYEYIYSGKPIICVKYGESEKFGEQVYLYANQDAQSFVSQIKIIEENGFVGKLKPYEIIEYLRNNTWESRCNQIIEFLMDNK